MTIGQVAEQAGVNVQTVRFYERKGLIAEPIRSAAGYRQYTSDTVRRIRFIRHAQAVGFSLREITELMSLRADPASSCAEVKEKALEKASEIETRIVTLTNMAVALTRMAEKCDSDSLIGDCPILDALDDNSIGDSP